jgi:hypothetical protein
LGCYNIALENLDLAYEAIMTETAGPKKAEQVVSGQENMKDSGVAGALTQERYETSESKVRGYITLQGIRWVVPLTVSAILSGLVSDFSRHASAGWPDEWALWVNFGFGMFSVVLSVYLFFKAERKVVELSKDIAFGLSTDVAKAIGTGKLLTASLLADELFAVLPNLLRRRAIKSPLGTSPNLKKVLYMPDCVSRSKMAGVSEEIGRAVKSPG